MKRKLLSLVLCLTLLFTTVSVGFTVNAEAENLITNGDFEKFTGTTPENWGVGTSQNASAEIVEDVQIAEGVTANAVKFTTTANNNSNRSNLYYTGTVKIEKNAKYTTTYWVKVKNVKGFRTYMYEPNYIDKNGVSKSNPTAQEGLNIYSFSYDNGSTRVIRTDISHSFKIAETNTVIDATGPSMFIARANNVEQVLTPDYPSTSRQDEWFQIIHTFETGNVAAHEAEISYQFSVPEAVDGELWVADVQMTVEKSDVIDFYEPKINDYSLGVVSPAGEIPIYKDVETVITAEPLGENTFVGWYNGDELVSTDEELRFNYSKDTPVYEARFEKGEFGIDGSYENCETTGKVANDTKSDPSQWTEELFKQSSHDSVHYVESNNAGTWRKALITTDNPHTGNYSLKFDGIWGSVGRKFTGLSKNSNYTITFYAQSVLTSGAETASIGDIIVTDANRSYIKSVNGNLSTAADGETGILYKDPNKHNTVGEWQKFTVNFNTKDSTDVILWINSSSSGAYLYLDNFAIARGNIDYTPTINDAKLGFVSNVSTKDGAKTTISATPLGEAIFNGWYVDGELVSDKESLTFTYNSANPPKYEARFTGSGFGIDGSFENGYTLNQNLTQEAGIKANSYTEDAFLSSSKDNLNHFVISIYGDTWRKAFVTNQYAHSGKNSLCFAGQYGYLGHKISGLTQNTEYIFSYYAYLTFNEGEKFNGISNGTMITDANTSPLALHNGSLAIRSAENKGVIVKDTAEYSDVTKGWKKHTISFNSGDNEEVIFWIGSSGKDAKLYLDDLAISRMAEITITPSRLGSTTKLENNKVPYNSKLTVTATPYEGNEFEGWYIDNELVSEDATLVIYADGNKNIAPKFLGSNTPAYEHFAASGMDGTFETGTVGTWTFSDPEYSSDWCKIETTSDEAYEGNNSAAIYARHRNSVLALTKLHKHTRYTLSFMFKLNEIEKEAADGSGIIKKAQIALSGITTPDVFDMRADTPYIAKTNPIESTAEWQKYEITFNSGNNEVLNFVLRFSCESDISMYIDNLELTVGNYEDHAYDNACDPDCNYCGEAREVPDHVYDDDKDPDCNECGETRILFTPGNVNGDELNAVDLTDVVLLAQYVAKWEVDCVVEALDPNGDGDASLTDVVLLAQYVAKWDVTLSDTPYVPAE